jgi:HD-GYP domain-containing protein (c-di-GMP phosphodiesterase class II)
MRRHSYYGYHILAPIADFKTINNWASLHHERIDGTGYPFHISGDDLSLGSRVMCVADLFQAVGETRPYRKAMDNPAILELIVSNANKGAVDPELAQILINNFEEINEFRKLAEEETLRQYSEMQLPKTASTALSRP